MDYSYQPLILIGAARSGTKLVRDLVAAHPHVDKVPYDIGYIWRLGNEKVPHDALSPGMLDPEKRRRILAKMGAFSRGAPFLVEKTVSNCLRVPFVQAVFPDARFIHLIRDGRDVIESSYRQWLAPPDWSYIIRKAVSFPLVDAFGYAVEYARDAYRKALPGRQRAPVTWGPLYEGILDDLTAMDVLEVCALQWARCVEKALDGLQAVPPSRVLVIRYEEFVRDPRAHLVGIARFGGFDPSFFAEKLDVGAVSLKNIGKGMAGLSATQRERVMPCIRDALSMLHYD